MSRRSQQPHHAAYVLSLIRAGTDTWSGLCSRFDLDPEKLFTGQNMLLHALRSLQDAQLITVQPESALREVGIDAAALGPMKVFPSLLQGKVLDALKISLADLANSDPHQRIVANPIPQRTFSSRYKSSVLVLMPFAPELLPVYEDHLVPIAKQLGLTIARADDFFTTEHIVDEIWTALVEADLVVADCTDRNPNVFYEIGLAHAIGKPTVLITQRAEDIPFDLKHRRHLQYSLTPRGMKAFEEVFRKTLETLATDDDAGP